MAKIALLVSALLLSNLSFAGTKVKKVDLDNENINIIRAELDADQVYYHMDTKACICWMSVFPDISNPLSISTFDCSLLGVYKAFKESVEKCSPKGDSSVIPEQHSKAEIAPPPAALTQEQAKLDKKEIPEEKETKVVPVQSTEDSKGPAPASE
jgi:hypothetical protein